MPVRPNEGTLRLELENWKKDAGEDFDESEEEDIGNNDWILGAYVHTDDEDKYEKKMYLAVYVTCNKRFKTNLWSCNTSIRFTLVNFKDKSKSLSCECVRKFANKDNKLTIERFKPEVDITSEKSPFCKRGKIAIEASIRVINGVGFKKYVREKFDEPKEHLTDVVLLVEGKKVHVGKQTLAMHSPVFHKLFYGNFAEKSKAEIPIEGVVHSEFVEFLNFIYPTNMKLDKNNVEYILKLADRFEVSSIIDKAEQFLIETDDIHMVDKLRYAEKYKIADVQEWCYDSFKNSTEVFELTKHKRYDQLGDATLSILFQKLVEFKNAD